MSIHTILSFGSNKPGSTCRHRAAALRRLGYQVTFLDPLDLLPKPSTIQQFINYRTGFRLIQGQLLTGFEARLKSLAIQPSLIWVNSGELLGYQFLQHLKCLFKCPLILYCNDDPTGPRDWSRFSSLRQAFPLYDLCVCRRDVNELEWLSLGASRVMRVWMSYDEATHKSHNFGGVPSPSLSFIGTNIPGEKRDQFLLGLAASGVPVRLYGNRWQKSSLWNRLRPLFCGPGLIDSAYAKQLEESVLSLGMLSHGNRDLHTRRSVETPSSGGLLCAERTSEHQLLYEDGHEAVFWDSPEECIHQCLKLLHEPTKNQAIRSSGHRHVRRLGVGNEDILRQILASV